MKICLFSYSLLKLRQKMNTKKVCVELRVFIAWEGGSGYVCFFCYQTPFSTSLIGRKLDICEKPIIHSQGSWNSRYLYAWREKSLWPCPHQVHHQVKNQFSMSTLRRKLDHERSGIFWKVKQQLVDNFQEKLYSKPAEKNYVTKNCCQKCWQYFELGFSWYGTKGNEKSLRSWKKLGFVWPFQWIWVQYLQEIYNFSSIH